MAQISYRGEGLSWRAGGVSPRIIWQSHFEFQIFSDIRISSFAKPIIPVGSASAKQLSRTIAVGVHPPIRDIELENSE